MQKKAFNRQVRRRTKSLHAAYRSAYDPIYKKPNKPNKKKKKKQSGEQQ